MKITSEMLRKDVLDAHVGHTNMSSPKKLWLGRIQLLQYEKTERFQGETLLYDEQEAVVLKSIPEELDEFYCI